MINITQAFVSGVGRWVLCVDGTGKRQKDRIKPWAHVVYVLYQCGKGLGSLSGICASGDRPGIVRI
jgi:hypothetical protein